MAIEELLKANLETHWYAVDQYGGLEVVEKDSKLTRCCRRLLDQLACRDSYSHIHYNEISTALASAVKNEWNRETVGKYLQVMERIKEKAGITGSLNDDEKRIVARFNQLGHPLIPAVSSENDIERIESIVQQIAQDAKPQHSQGNYIVFSREDGVRLKISKEGDTLRASDESLHKYVSDLALAKSVCKEQKLDLLALPDAVIIKIYLAGKVRDLLIEKGFEIDEESNYRFFDDQELRDEIVKQLAILTLNTGANVSYWDLCPVKSTNHYSAKRVVAIQNLDLGSVYKGLFGGKGFENNTKVGLEGLFNVGNATRMRNRAIIFKEIERKLGSSISSLVPEDCYRGCPGSSTPQIPRYKEIASNLRLLTAIKKKLDKLPLNQPEKNTFYVDKGREITLSGLERFKYSELHWDMSPPTDEQLMQQVVEELKGFGAITGVCSRSSEGWTLSLSGPSVEEAEIVAEDDRTEQGGMKKIIYSVFCDLIIYGLNLVTQEPVET